MSVLKIIGFFILAVIAFGISEDVFYDNDIVRWVLEFVAAGSFFAMIGSIYATFFNKKPKELPTEPVRQNYVYPDPKRTKSGKRRFCPECGGNLTPPGTFCGKCGTHIN